MLRSATLSDQSSQLNHKEWQTPSDDNLRTSMTSRLREASSLMNLDLTDDQIKRVIAYADLLLEWNRRVNLTAIRTMEGVVVKHFLDSFSVVEHVVGERIIDIGSGAGFPGIAVALVRPQIKVTLLDAKAKKVQFLRHAIARLGFTNVEVLHQRIQDFVPKAGYDTVLVRSLGSISAISEYSLPVVAPTGRVIAMKGKYPDKEISAIDLPCKVKVRKLEVPFLEGERHCVILQQVAKS